MQQAIEITTSDSILENCEKINPETKHISFLIGKSNIQISKETLIQALHIIARRTPDLTHLSLQGILNFSASELGEIANALPRMLIYLRIADHNWEETDLCPFFAGLPTTLLVLNLAFNYLVPYELNQKSAISNRWEMAFKSLRCSLVAINLCSTRISRLSREQIYRMVSAFPASVRFLNLANNIWIDELPLQVIAAKINLTNLDISGTGVNVINLLMVLPEHIICLNMSHNFCEGTLPSNFVSKVKSINLSNCRIYMDQQKQIAFFKGMPHLQELDLSGNTKLFKEKKTEDLIAIFSAFSQELKLLKLCDAGLSKCELHQLQQLKGRLPQVKKVYFSVKELMELQESMELQASIELAQLNISGNLESLAQLERIEKLERLIKLMKLDEFKKLKELKELKDFKELKELKGIGDDARLALEQIFPHAELILITQQGEVIEESNPVVKDNLRRQVGFKDVEPSSLLLKCAFFVSRNLAHYEKQPAYSKLPVELRGGINQFSSLGSDETSILYNPF